MRALASVAVVAAVFATAARADVFYDASVDVDPVSKRISLGLEYAASDNEVMAGKIVRVCWQNKLSRRICLSKAIPEPLGTDSSQVIFLHVSAKVAKNMRQYTTFTWYVAGAKVAAKRVRVR